MWGIEAKRPKYKQDERRLLLVPVGEILPNPDQPRREFAYDKLLELAQSIDENGLLNPITITLKGDKPVLVAGERRLRAAKIAGLREIPCLVVEADGERSALMALVENLQREDMNVFEQAEGIQRLIQVYGLTPVSYTHLVSINRMRALVLVMRAEPADTRSRDRDPLVVSAVSAPGEVISVSSSEAFLA